jgi:hypothetical protein
MLIRFAKQAIILVTLVITAASLLIGIASGYDISESEVNAALEAGIVPDALIGDYGKYVTRRDFAEMMVNTALRQQMNIIGDETVGEQFLLESVFTDSDDYYVNAAYALSIVKGYGDGTFHPESFITREEAATMLGNMLYNFFPSAIKHGSRAAEFVKYDDYDEISAWANDGAMYAYEFGLMKGELENKYMPKGHLSGTEAIKSSLELLNVIIW